MFTFPRYAHCSPLELLKTLVEINSGSQNNVGNNKVQKIVRKRMMAMGLDTVEFESEHPDYPLHPMLVGKIEGQSKRYISLITHSDTVFERDHSFQKFKLSPDKKTATGPGVIDDKGGIVVALEGLKKFLATTGKKPRYSIRLVVSPSEEIGSPGFQDKFREFSQDSFMVLGFEPALSDGSIIEGRRGNRWYMLETLGREAHAGRGHKDGINACHDLAIKIAQLSKLTDYKRNVTLSVGRMEGGKDKFNIVCGNARVKIDTRFSALSDANHLDKKLRAISSRKDVCSALDKKCATTTVKIVDDAPPFSRTKISEKYIGQYASIIGRIEKKEIAAKISGGAADTNYMSREGLIIIDGLGARGGNIHTDREFVEVESLESRSRALAEFLGFTMKSYSP